MSPNYCKHFVIIVWVVDLTHGGVSKSEANNTDHRIEDFFWTGSGDGPPAPADLFSPSPPVPSTVVRTTTVIATVYLDSMPNNAVTDKTTGDCVMNCGSDGIADSLQPSEEAVPDDRRYWLLTVVRGGTPDDLQLKLARLYQKAFLRQQERHLGIVKSLDAPSSRKKHETLIYSDNKNEKQSNYSYANQVLKNHEQKKDDKNKNKINADELYLSSIPTPVLDIKTSTISVSIISPTMYAVDKNDSQVQNIYSTKTDVDMWILATPTYFLSNPETVTDEDLLNLEAEKGSLIDIPLETEVNNSVVFKREIIRPDQQPPVKVHIQNVNQSLDSGNVEIVYVVMVGGRAVPATVAARDMRLVRDAEVAYELGYPVTTKAEPYLKATEEVEGREPTASIQGAELWALAVGSALAIILLLLVIGLMCRFARRKKTMSSAVLQYRNELLREAERNQIKQVHEAKDGRLISVVSPSRTRPSSTKLPIYRADSSTSSSSGSGISEIAAALKRKQKQGHRLRLPQKKRVGTTDSLLEAAGLGDSSSESIRGPSEPATPTSYLSMPSLKSFPRGNTVEPLSRVLEPVSVRHLDLDSSDQSPQAQDKSLKSLPQNFTQPKSEVILRRQMPSQLVRLGSIDKDPGVVGPLVWDLHLQRIRDKDKNQQTSPAKQPLKRTVSKDSSSPPKEGTNISKMRQRFNELVDDAFSLFGSSPGSSPRPVTKSRTLTVEESGAAQKAVKIAQARNDNVRLPGSPYTALDTIRGRSADTRNVTTPKTHGMGTSMRPRTSLPRQRTMEAIKAPASAWVTPPPRPSTCTTPRLPVVNPAFILAEGRLPPEDPALPLISAIKTEIERVRRKPETRGV